MSSLPPETPTEFTASDVLSADLMRGRAAPPVLGIDVACTKIAVDFQNMRRESAAGCVQRNLELIAEITASDCAFMALIGPEGSFGEVQVVRRGFAQCQPESLRGSS